MQMEKERKTQKDADITKMWSDRNLREENMKVKRCVKESFVVIGKAGSTLEGEGFIQRLWADANTHFGEVQHLAKKDENGNISGIWGLCLISRTHSIRGKISTKDFILLG